MTIIFPLRLSVKNGKIDSSIFVSWPRTGIIFFDLIDKDRLNADWSFSFLNGQLESVGPRYRENVHISIDQSLSSLIDFLKICLLYLIFVFSISNNRPRVPSSPVGFSQIISGFNSKEIHRNDLL